MCTFPFLIVLPLSPCQLDSDERSVGQKNVMLDIKQQVEAELNELDDLNDNDSK